MPSAPSALDFLERSWWTPLRRRAVWARIRPRLAAAWAALPPAAQSIIVELAVAGLPAPAVVLDAAPFEAGADPDGRWWLTLRALPDMALEDLRDGCQRAGIAPGAVRIGGWDTSLVLMMPLAPGSGGAGPAQAGAQTRPQDCAPRQH